MKKGYRDFLLEIDVEELPVSYVRHALDSLQQGLEERFGLFRVGFGRIYAAGTATKLVCHIKDVMERSEPLVQDIKGPPKKIALDEKGNWTKQALGFAKAQGADVKDLVIKTTKNGEYCFRKAKTSKGLPTKDYLAEIIPDVIKNTRFPKTMKWDSSGLRFARPIVKIRALFGKDTIPVCFEGKPSAFRAKRIPAGPAAYLKDIQKQCLLDPYKRKERIRSLIKDATKKLKADFYIDEDLLEEVNFMVSSPVIFAGGFDKRFLALPADVLKASMAKHQRVFPVSKKGKLVNRFIAVINGRGRDTKAVRKNYENTLEAKLKDSLFFLSEDIKNPLPENNAQLKSLIFQKDLGNMFEKIVRLQALCSFICDVLGADDALKKDTLRAAELSKADLVTHMVGEFPSLQGRMGGEYALRSGEKKEVATAIREHYLPQGAEDDLPETDAGAILALSDKIDNIIGFCGLDTKKISGSSDPFGIRRNALGLIQIVRDKNFRFDIRTLIQKAIELYGDRLEVSEGFGNKVADYIKDRLEFLMEGVKPAELRKAVLASGDLDIVDIFNRIDIFRSIKHDRCFLEAAKVVERTSNILKAAKKEEIGRVDEGLLREDPERGVWNAYLNIKGALKELIDRERYKEATESYARAFYGVLHDFFDKVLVNVDDKALRLNRLAVMKEINRLYTDRVADLAMLPQIVVE